MGTLSVTANYVENAIPGDIKGEDSGRPFPVKATGFKLLQ